MNQTQKCPMCAEQIPLDVVTCSYCGAQFEVTSRGYCQNCHQVREADGNGQCKVCGNAVVDIRVESNVIEEAPQKTAVASESAAQPDSRKSGTKKTAAIVGTIVVSLLCGFPGVFSVILGLVSLYGTVSPDVPPEILTETLEQNQISRQELFNYSLIFVFVGILLILVPIVFGVLTLRDKRTVARSPKKSWGSVLAQIVAACLILVGAGYLLFKVGTPKLNLALADPTATSTPDLLSLNAYSPQGKSYETAQEIADTINANGLTCTFNSANLSSVPILDIGNCWFTQEERETLGTNLDITIELFANAIPPLVQATREGYWDSYSNSIKGLTDANAEILVGPNWFIHGKLSALIRVQKILGGDILNFFNETDKQIYISR